MGFNPAFIPIRTIDPGIRGYNAGDVPSSWAFYSSSSTPANAVIAPDYSPGAANVIKQTIAAAHSCYYEDLFITNGDIPHRFYGAVRGTQFGSAGGGGNGTAGVIYGTRLGSDGFGLGAACASIPHPTDLNKCIFKAFLVDNNSNNLSKDFTQIELTPDTWYGVGLGVLGTTVNFYLDLNGGQSVTDLAGPEELTHIWTKEMSVSFRGHQVFITSVGGGASTATVWSGMGDAILEELQGPTHVAKPGMGDDPGPLPAPMPGSGPIGWPKFPAFKMPIVSTDFGYWRMKAIRQLTFAMNNLRIGP